MTMSRHPSSSLKLATLKFGFSYVHNQNNTLPNWPYFPANAVPYDYDNVKFKDITAGFNKVVGAQWGRVINGIDMSEKGVNQMVGSALWGDTEILCQKDVLTATPEANGTNVLGRIESMTVVYPNNSATETRNAPILLAGGLGQMRFGLVLIPMQTLKLMSRESVIGCLGDNAYHTVAMSLRNIAIPFPFYAAGVTAQDYTCFDNVDVDFSVSVSTEYAISYIGLYDTKSLDMVIRVPGAPNSALLDGFVSKKTSSSLFGQLAQLMEGASKRCLFPLGSLQTTDGDVLNNEISENRNLLIKTFGSTELPKPVKFEKIDKDAVPVPAGLDELPLLPTVGYSYICDFQGIVYVTDANRVGVMMPYQVFNLEQMRKTYEAHADKSDKIVVEYGRQIELVDALFKHQARVLAGTGYAYEALNFQDT